MRLKEYIVPVTETVPVRYESELLAGSPNPGVEQGDDLGDEFDEGDVTYSKPVITDIWKGDDDSENEW